ncbi:rCG23004, isoform CRA_c [Rattus norvegicus]|uniref:RCG23004, isoform CRA_c n=1 Tax=Rattus norvegicus TaxID=10116 RepID=A6KB95_RAT|nr:rCG23004, isoform CRA_c [Rattus norvegicus]
MEREETVAKDPGPQAGYSLFFKEKIKEETRKEMADSPLIMSQIKKNTLQFTRRRG